MQNRQVPTPLHPPHERLQLPLGRVRPDPDPVLDVDAPVHDDRVVDVSREMLAGSSADCAVWGAEVAGCILCVSDW